MKRAKLSLGPRQVERLLLAISYAVDTLFDDEEAEEPNNRRALREWEELRETIRKARSRAGQ